MSKQVSTKTFVLIFWRAFYELLITKGNYFSLFLLSRFLCIFVIVFWSNFCNHFLSNFAFSVILIFLLNCFCLHLNFLNPYLFVAVLAVWLWALSKCDRINWCVNMISMHLSSIRGVLYVGCMNLISFNIFLFVIPELSQSFFTLFSKCY